MVKQYDQPIKDEIRCTSLNKEGMKKIVDMTVKAIAELDLAIDQLNEQRSSLIEILSNYNSLYQVLEGSSLVDSNQIRNLESQPKDLQSVGFFRELALQEADRQANHPKFEGKVTVEYIENYLKTLGELPWKNPKNAIDTILNRSGKYRKIETGIWEKK